MTGFTIQETIISGLYLYEARRILRPGKVFQKKQTNEVLKHLIWVNAFVIFLDAALLATEYAGLFSIQTVFKAAVYSVKLRFEFVVLNQLMDIVGSRGSAFSLSGAQGSGTHDTSRSGHQIQLGTIPTRPQQHQPENYSAFVFPSSDEPGDRKSGGVLRTTEVQVDSASRTTEDEIHFEPYDQYGEEQKAFPATTWSRPRQPSTGSSEENFAARGAVPT